jgi:hypothetical protein
MGKLSGRTVLTFVDELDAQLLRAENLIWVVPAPCDPPDGVTVVVDDGQFARTYGIGKASAVLDANLRVEAIIGPGEPIPAPPDHDLAAPILVVPRVLEPEFCAELRAHRDNTTAGTAHRRFAVAINLNDDFDGGELRFPEFGRPTRRTRPGDALVFSCSLLHEVTPVTAGRRFCTLPFLHDEAAERVRRTAE